MTQLIIRKKWRHRKRYEHHDDFIFANELLPGANARTTFTLTEGCSVEAGEPMPSAGTVYQTSWFKLNAPAGTITLHTGIYTADEEEYQTLPYSRCYSKKGQAGFHDTMDCIVAVYTGADLGSLSEVASSGGTTVGNTVELDWPGGVMWIQVGCAKDLTVGQMVLYYDCGTGTPPPPPPPGGNDNVADATAVTNVDGGQDLTFDNTALTVESGEPVPSAVGAIFRTAWWVITVSGSVSIFATGEGDAGNTNLFIALYSGGPSFGSMVEIASADDCNNSGFINPTVGAGTYYLQVGESANVIDTAVDVFLNTT